MSGFPIKNFIFGVLGGITGGVVGGFICRFLADQGLYAVVIPGALVGLGFGLAAKKGHIVFGLVSGIMGLLAGLMTQWLVYSNEPSFFKLVAELKDYHVMTFILLGLGTLLAFSFGKGNTYNVRKQKFDTRDRS